jgi:hypothetical protein
VTVPPDPTAPPATIGAQPTSAFEVSSRVGAALRQFLAAQATIAQDQDWLAGADLKAAPYYYTPEQETDTKTAIASLDQALSAIDLTFVNRLVGLV